MAYGVSTDKKFITNMHLNMPICCVFLKLDSADESYGYNCFNKQNLQLTNNHSWVAIW